MPIFLQNNAFFGTIFSSLDADDVMRSRNFLKTYFPWELDSTCHVSCHLVIISLKCCNLNEKFQILKCDPCLNLPEILNYTYERFQGKEISKHFQILNVMLCFIRGPILSISDCINTATPSNQGSVCCHSNLGISMVYQVICCGQLSDPPFKVNYGFLG